MNAIPTKGIGVANMSGNGSGNSRWGKSGTRFDGEKPRLAITPLAKGSVPRYGSHRTIVPASHREQPQKRGI